MLLTKEMESSINKQINEELFSAYLYQSMAAYFETQSFEGMASWMELQAQEEMFHAKKFYDYVNERGGKVILTAIEGPKTQWGSVLDVFEDALEHERYITGCIYKLFELAIEQKDHMTNVFLNWYITEQAEEEGSIQKIIDNLKKIKDSSNGLFMMDKELGKRTLQPEPDSI